MITIIAATNRQNSNTLKIAKFYLELMKKHTQEVQLLSLLDLPNDLADPKMYDEPSESFKKLQKQYLVDAEKFVLIMPEYNGGIPGILKLMIDISDIKPCWHYKKVCMVGVAAGRAGNLRGMDDFTSWLNYIKVGVHYLKIPISGVAGKLDDSGRLNDQPTIDLLNQQIEDFVSY